MLPPIYIFVGPKKFFGLHDLQKQSARWTTIGENRLLGKIALGKISSWLNGQEPPGELDPLHRVLSICLVS